MAKRLTNEELERLLEDDSCSDLEDEDSDLDFEVCDSDDAEVEDIIEAESDDELPNEEEDTENSNNNFEANENIIFTSNSGFPWNSFPPASTRTRAHNIVSSPTGLREEANNITSVKDAFNLFISSNMLEEIATHTNQFCQRRSDSKQISTCELEAFIGILLASGRCNGRRLALKEIWTTNQLFKFYFFSVSMSRDKFSYIYSNLRFDDKNTRQSRLNLTGDKFEPIRSIYNYFNAACLKNFSPGFYITVDERLATFRGKCPFRVYMKSKPGRYGIKIWVGADATTAYILNSQPYTGKNQNRREVNQGERVVTDLVRPFYGTGRGVTTDNFFTSIPLANGLLENNLTLTGTIRKNKREIPKEFLNTRNREELSTLFGFSDNLTLISYVPKKNTSVLLLSTEFHNSEVEEGPKKRPSMILHYNKTKGGVDTGDKMTHQYSCVRATRRWPFRIFMEIIDMAALNAYIIWIHKYPEWRKNDRSRRQNFLKELAMELVKENVLNRKNSGKHFHKHIQHGFELYDKAMNGENVTPATLATVSQVQTRGRCSFCPRNQDRKSKIHCNFCKKTICVLHRTQSKIVTCPDCKQEHDVCD